MNHTLTKYGTTRCPLRGGVAANVDDGECSACGAPVDDMNLELGSATAAPNSHWFTQSAVDEITAGLKATLEARTAALTRTIARAEKAEAKLREVEALADEWETDYRGDAGRDWWPPTVIAELRAVLEGGR